MEEILRMQENLLLIRRTVGWTAEAFGERIGVTRQTINNIEAGRNKLTKTQYIAMRSVLDAEIARCPDETELLQLILEMLVDHPQNYKIEDKQVLLDKANMITPSILAGTATRKAASSEIMKSMGAILGGTLAVGAIGLGVGLATGPLVAGGLGAWLVKVVASEKKK